VKGVLFVADNEDVLECFSTKALMGRSEIKTNQDSLKFLGISDSQAADWIDAALSSHNA